MNIKLYKNNIFKIILLPALLLFIMGCGKKDLGDAIVDAIKNAPQATYDARRKTGFTLPPKYSQLPRTIDLADEHTLNLIIKATDAEDDQRVPYTIYLDKAANTASGEDIYFYFLKQVVLPEDTTGSLHSLVYHNRIVITNATSRDFSLSIHSDIDRRSDTSLFLVSNYNIRAGQQYTHRVDPAPTMAKAVERMGINFISIDVGDRKRANFAISHAPGYKVFVLPDALRYQTNAGAYTFRGDQVLLNRSGNERLRALPSFAPLIIVENLTLQELPRVELFGRSLNNDERSLFHTSLPNFLAYQLKKQGNDSLSYRLRVYYDQSNFKEESLDIINNLFRELVY